jgi:hypothetical protein
MNVFGQLLATMAKVAAVFALVAIGGVRHDLGALVGNLRGIRGMTGVSASSDFINCELNYIVLYAEKHEETIHGVRLNFTYTYQM